MEITKSNWETDGDSMRLAMPIAKVDTERRQVSGWATLDNVDHHGDVVTAEASTRAFARFRGNIREMHQPIAAGKLVDFKEDEFYDPTTEKFYRGVYVTAYISKGAQTTWEKVLDGTLSGFSIGGKVIKFDNEWNKDSNEQVRFIKDYELSELSLVDSPANQLANVFSIAKTVDGEVMKGMIAETKIVNVYWCPADKISKNSVATAETCSICGGTMESIGWFESGENSVEKVKDIVSKHLNAEQPPVTGEGGVNVTANKDDLTKEVGSVQSSEESMKNSVPEQEEAEKVDETEGSEDEKEEAEKAEDDNPKSKVITSEDVDEVDSPDLEKMIADLHAAVKDSLVKTETATTEASTAVARVEEQMVEISKSMQDKTSDLETKLTALDSKLDALKSSSSDVAKRLDALEGETAVKKSGDLSSDDSIEKSADKGAWSGAFLSVKDL